MAGTSDLLELTVTLTSSTLVAAGVAGFMPHVIGDEPNSVVGIRTKATMSSPEAWQAAHQVARPLLRRTAWIAVAGLCVQAVIGIAAGFGSAASAVAASVVCVATFGVLIYAAVAGNAAAKGVPIPPGRH